MEIILDNDDSENKKEAVFEKWEKDVADLFSGNHIPPGFNDICARKCKLEMIMNTPGYRPNIF